LKETGLDTKCITLWIMRMDKKEIGYLELMRRIISLLGEVDANPRIVLDAMTTITQKLIVKHFVYLEKESHNISEMIAYIKSIKNIRESWRYHLMHHQENDIQLLINRIQELTKERRSKK